MSIFSRQMPPAADVAGSRISCGDTITSPFSSSVTAASWQTATGNVGTYSYAPMSTPSSCGRGAPGRSLDGAGLAGSPVSLHGDEFVRSNSGPTGGEKAGGELMLPGPGPIIGGTCTSEYDTTASPLPPRPN